MRVDLGGQQRGNAKRGSHPSREDAGAGGKRGTPAESALATVCRPRVRRRLGGRGGAGGRRRCGRKVAHGVGPRTVRWRREEREREKEKKKRKKIKKM